MKKTIITASIFLGISLGAQAATTTYFHDLSVSSNSESGLSFNLAEKGYSTITATGSDKSALYTSNSGDQLSTAITFTFNLTAVKTALTTTGNSLTLVSIDLNPSNSTNTSSAGFTITLQEDGTYNAYISSGTNGTFTNISLIEENIATDFTSGGKSYATFTLTTGKIKGNSKVGFSAYDATGQPASGGQATGYMSAYNTGLDSFSLDTSYVTSAAITSKSLTDATEIAAISALTIPEPATATLSLLALAGLAARRRRK